MTCRLQDLVLANFYEHYYPFASKPRIKHFRNRLLRPLLNGIALETSPTELTFSEASDPVSNPSARSGSALTASFRTAYNSK